MRVDALNAEEVTTFLQTAALTTSLSFGVKSGHESLYDVLGGMSRVRGPPRDSRCGNLCLCMSLLRNVDGLAVLLSVTPRRFLPGER